MYRRNTNIGAFDHEVTVMIQTGFKSTVWLLSRQKLILDNNYCVCVPCPDYFNHYILLVRMAMVLSIIKHFMNSLNLPYNSGVVHTFFKYEYLYSYLSLTSCQINFF